MSFYKFMTFDPYLTFAEGERGFREKKFLRADGVPSGTLLNQSYAEREYLPYLWRAGSDAYATVAGRLGRQPKAEDFKNIADTIKRLEKDLEPEVQQLIQSGALTVREYRDSPPITNLTTIMEDTQSGWLLEVFMEFAMPGVIAGHLLTEDLPDFEGLLCGTVVMNLDDCLTADALGSADMDMFSESVHGRIASVKLYRKTVDAAKEAVSAAGRRSANVRHQLNNKQKAIALAEWDARRAKISSMAAFARARHKDFEVSERTLYGWIREHCKEKA